MLAHEDERDFGGEATEDHSLGVDDVPIWLNVGFLHVSGLAWHVCSFVAPPGMGRESIKIGLFAKMSRGGDVYLPVGCSGDDKRLSTTPRKSPRMACNFGRCGALHRGVPRWI
jgi:hypothetical protein